MFKLVNLTEAGSCALLIASLANAAPAVEKTAYGFGSEATPSQIAGWNIDVRPDGTGLPVGHGSVEEGQTVYDAKCAVCHGTFGESGDYIQLAGGVGSLQTQTPVRTVGSLLSHATTLWDYINRAMPFPNSKSLTANEVYAVTAYVLNLSDVVKAGTTLDEKSLPQLKMPNQNGFTTDHGFMTVSGKPDVVSRECMENCAAEVKITSQLPPGFVAQNYGDLSTQFRGLTMMSAPAGAQAEAIGRDPGPKKQGLALAQANGCTACHAVDQKIVGPAFKDVAAKYKSSANALDTLTKKVRSGGSGAWGSVPMPAQTGPSDADLKAILTWILALGPAS
jgi:cytochrome c